MNSLVPLALLAAAIAAQDPPPPAGEPAAPAPPLLELARKHRDALAGASRVEKQAADLRVECVHFPDALEWILLGELIAGFEAKESLETIRERLSRARRKYRSAAGRPGFRIELRHDERPDDTDREAPRTVHLFPADPAAMLRATYGDRLAEWTPLEPPAGLARGRVRIAKHFTTKNRRTVPFIQELEPKGERWVFDGESARVLGMLPESLTAKAAKQSGSLAIAILGFDRFRGPSPEPHLLDLNATESSFERELTLALARSWPPPWPPLPGELAEILRGDAGE